MTLSEIDRKLIAAFQAAFIPAARFGLFAVYFWFGLLKVFGLSPAGPLVHDLLARTLPFVSFESFFLAFGLFECLIGILFVIKRAERIVIPLLLVHMATTFMPLFLLPQETWSGFLIPTLEGQYIIKNLLIIAAAVGVASHLRPLPYRRLA